jgi:hypothetical protein
MYLSFNEVIGIFLNAFICGMLFVVVLILIIKS